MTLLHLDTDIGGDIDDVCALAYLLGRHDVELAGVTTVLDADGRRAGMARRVLDLAGRTDVRVARGYTSDQPRFRERGFELPPENRYWADPIVAVDENPKGAIDLLEASIKRGATILTIGPLTNLARLDARRPGALAGVSLVAMAGSVFRQAPGYPGTDAEWDFNTQADVAAAHLVFRAVGQLVLVPVEVTFRVPLTRSDVDQLAVASGVKGSPRPLVELLVRQARAWDADYDYAGRYAGTPALPADVIAFLHDPLAAAVACGWDGATVEDAPIAWSTAGERLRMRVEKSPASRNVRIVTRVDAPAFRQHFLATLTQPTT